MVTAPLAAPGSRELTDARKSVLIETCPLTRRQTGIRSVTQTPFQPVPPSAWKVVD